ncbi:hypothetical protein KY316_03495 [Candidatus Woesearchaeota archaeon]|nr:hypothetical protein [Candidatus Woesearchaeota archaeon]
MYEYWAEVYVEDSHCGEDEFWDLMRKYKGVGHTQSWKDDELRGKNSIIFLKSEKPLKREDLQKEYYFMTIEELGLLEQAVVGK